MDPSALEGMEDDPAAMGQMMRKMGKEMGEEMPPEFDDVVDRLEAGQSPEEIEFALPDMGAKRGIKAMTNKSGNRVITCQFDRIRWV